MILHLESSEFSFTLEPEKDSPSTLGRDEGCDCVVENDSVSRKHAELTFEDGQWLINDLGSRFGTLVNGKPVKKPTALADGDVLKLASKNFVVSLSSSNEMEDLGAHLAGGKLKGLLKQAANGPKNAGKPVVKRKQPPKQTMMLAKDDGSADTDEKPAAEAAQAESGETDAEEVADSDESAKSNKKSMKLRKREAPPSSPIATAVKAVLILAILGVGGFYGYKHWQEQQNAAAGGSSDDPATKENGETAPPVLKLPPKPTINAAPATNDAGATQETPPPPADKPADAAADPAAPAAPADASAPPDAAPKKE
ncbi:MAG TPA: FHA domain-containing protein [Planctomycetota bacterium]|nr:FHA domain-containing protein [Planctomycetota bacterium]